MRAFHREQLAIDFSDGCFALNTVREKHVVPRSAWSTVEEFSATVREGLRRNLKAAADAGELSADRDPDLLARVLAAFDMGLLSYRSLGASAAEAGSMVEEIERLLE